MANIFITRSYSIVEREYFLNFDMLLKTPITIVSGDGGVGKIYQLKQYYAEHEKTSLYIDITNFDSELSKNIEKDIDVVFVDSIDEFQAIEPEKDIVGRLIAYIIECKKNSPKIRFVLSHRTYGVESFVRKIELSFNEIQTIKILPVPQGKTFEDIIRNDITVILGEPASGKTSQLKEYRKSNEKSLFVPLVTLRGTDVISENIDVVLIDSIDEALHQSNTKTLARELEEYIVRCKNLNPNVKFIITCRLLEWNNYFRESLKSININSPVKSFAVYDILPLNKQDIDLILSENNIDKDAFWKFVKDNYIETLLKNILVIFQIVEKFNEYKNSKISYIDIYHDIAKRYLSNKGEDREEIVADKPIDELLHIASSLAAYILFNRKESVPVNDLVLLSSELYKANNKEIVANDLKLLLTTALFEKAGDQFIFFQNSIQEYLVAYFIANRDLDLKTLKKLFSSNIRFYEEFEEVIIYLSNIQPEFFDDFVEFDPFIFKRHPNLDRSQQEKLLISMLDKLQNNPSIAWGKWDYFKNTTIVKFNKIEDFPVVIKANIDMSNIDNVIFPYLMKLLEYNYSRDMEDLIFSILDNCIAYKKECRTFIKNNFIDNFTFNSRLIIFMKEHDLLDKDSHSFFSFETHLFQSLYGINFAFDSTSLNPKGFDFTNLLSLLDYIPHNQLKYITPYLNPSDSLTWYEYIKENYNDSKYSSEFIAWVIYVMLNNITTYSDRKILLIDIVEFLKSNRIYIHKIDKEEIKLSFNDLAQEFWELYFIGHEGKEFDRWETTEILNYYTLALKDIKEASKKYPIEKYADKYAYFNRITEQIHDFLMSNDVFKAYMEDIWERQKVQENERQEEDDNSEHFIERKLQEDKDHQIYIKSIENLCSEKDMYKILNYLMHKNREGFIEQLKDDLEDKLPVFIDLAKKEFLYDKSYLALKKELTSNSLSNSPTFLFAYLFKILSMEEIYSLVKNEEEYQKLFWHTYRYFHQMGEDYFVKLSKMYLEKFKALIIESIQLSLEQSKTNKVGKYYEYKELFESLNILDKSSLSSLIRYISKIDMAVFASLEHQDRLFLLEMLSLDDVQYKFIKELMIHDQDNCSDYFRFLIQLSPNSALNDFKLNIYELHSRYIGIHVKICRYFGGCKKQTDYLDGNYNENIHIDKIKAFICLMRAFSKNSAQLDILKSQYIKLILIDYYEFFKEYKRPEGVYSPGIYDNMHDFIDQVWNYLITTSEHVELLEALTKEKDERLATHAGSSLEKAYNQQLKDRNITNSYYKEIFDKEESLESNTTINISGSVHGSVIDRSKNKKVYLDKLEKH